jgi:hypothetical protein
MARLDNWQTNLSQLINDKKEEPFNFPTWNCLMWAIDGILAVSGNDYGKDYRGKYETELGAARILKKYYEVDTCQEFLEKHLNNEAKPIAFARNGDIVLTNDPELTPTDVTLFGFVPGICYGANSFFVGEFGLIKIETLRLGATIWVS